MSTVLIADDDRQITSSLARFFTRRGYQTWVANDGKTAVELAADHHPDVVLCDVRMPQLDGYGVLEAIRRDPAAAGMAFILLTGLDEQEHVRRGMTLGADDYIAKPCSPEDLLQAVDTQIQKKAAVVALETKVRERTAELVTANAELQVEVGNRRRAEKGLQLYAQELARRNRDMESLISAVSHDLRSPLINLQGFGNRIDKLSRKLAQILSESGGDLQPRLASAQEISSRLGEAVQFILTTTRRMDGLTYGLLQWSRTGQQALELQTLDLRAILDSIREDFHIQIEQTSAVIEYGELPPVYGDRIQVSQILCNLLSNALRYRAPDRPLRVRVSGRPEPELVEVSVEDNGVGIEPAYQERIWEMFYHVDPAGKNTDGEGIGLTIVRQAVERHGGRVWVESTPGVGSTFHFTLPRQPLEA